MDRFKAESMHVKGAPECMRVSGFMHGITNPELIRRLNDNIPQTVDEMWRVTTAFLRGETAAANLSRKKDRSSWKPQESGAREVGNQLFERKTEFKGRSRADRRRSDRFTLLTKTPERNPGNEHREVYSSSTHGKPGRIQKQRQIL